MTTNGHRLIAKTLKALGVETVFGEVGVPITPVAFDLQTEGVQFISHRSENPAVYAAGAYGYLTSGGAKHLPGVALTTGGPGFINAISGLANATVNCFPLVLLSGSAPQDKVGKGAFQELDQLSIVGNNTQICKYAFQIKCVEGIPATIIEAFRAALSGTHGGVFVDIPTDVLNGSVSCEKVAESLQICNFFSYMDVPTTRATPAEFVELTELLKEAKAPLLVIGKGSAQAQAEAELTELVDLLGIAFLPTPMGRGVVADNHPLSVAAERSRALADCDVAILCGARLNWILHFGECPRWRKDAKFVFIGYGEGTQDFALSLTGDIRATLQSYLHHIKSTNASFELSPEAKSWTHQIAEASCVKREKSLRPATVGDTHFGMKFSTAMGILRHHLEQIQTSHPETKITIIAEGANTMDSSRVGLPVFRPRGRLDAGTWGTMGVGLGYAIAANIADRDPNHYVLAVEGDSALGFSLAELETICRYELPILVIVFNNGGVYTGERSSTGVPLPTQLTQNTRYDKVMEGLGGCGYRAANPAEFKNCLVKTAEMRPARPCLIDLLIDPTDAVTTGGVVTKASMGQRH